MLILTRKIGEKIMIGDDLVIQVDDLGRKVYFSITNKEKTYQVALFAGYDHVLNENPLIRIVMITSGTERARIGVDAPKDVKVWREELLPRVRKNEAGERTPNATLTEIDAARRRIEAQKEKK